MGRKKINTIYGASEREYFDSLATNRMVFHPKSCQWHGFGSNTVTSLKNSISKEFKKS